MKPLGIKRNTRPTGQTRNPVPLCFQRVIFETVELLEPSRVRLRHAEIEKARVEDFGESHIAFAGLDNPRATVQGPNDRTRRRNLFRRGHVELFEHDHVGELDLIHE